MKQYLELLNHIKLNGVNRMDRTLTGTRGVFGYQMRFNLADGFPAVTTKKLAWRAVVSELLWFIEGSGDERRLAEILHGTRAPSKTTIWTANSQADYWKNKAKFPGDCGEIYGVQWRNWKTIPQTLWEKIRAIFGYQPKIDQFADLIAGIKKDPYGRRHILTAWNPAALNDMALPPCHVMSQFYVSENKLSCQLYQRSCDVLLGLPFNIASYALLTHMIAAECGLEVGDFVWTGGDVHIYSNHMQAVDEQLTRAPDMLPDLDFTKKPIYTYVVDDFKLLNYQPQAAIKAPMAV